ncbi:MAG: DUF502 domain-containing protein [Paracoccaceae bacterium]
MAAPKKKSARPAQRSTIAALRNNFLTGLIVVAPIVITIYLTWTIITFVDAQVVPLVPEPLRVDIGLPGFGVLIFLVFTTAVGYFAKHLFGRQLIRLGESWVDRMPIVRSIYNALKQIVETIFNQSNASFQRACLVEYPRRDIWAIAFVSTDTKGEIAQKVGENGMVSVFLPTTPNPTSGFLLFVPAEDVVLLDMSVEEAAKLVISAGLVTPPTKEEREAAARRAQVRKNGNGNGRSANGAARKP